MPELKHWESFYVIVGAAAGALIGLQFVVMTLVAERAPKRGGEVGDTYATPTIVHFSVAFLLSALVSAPWRAVSTLALLWGIIGLGGVVYIVIVARRMHAQTAYRPEKEDWLSHALLPLIAYLTLALAACAASSNEHEALFGVGGAVLLLVFIGIHNSWDAIAYLATKAGGDT